MSHLSAPTILTLFNLLALAYFVSTTLVPSRATTLLRQSLVVLCLSISLCAYILALLINQPGASIATVTAAGCLNLLLLSSVLTRRLKGPSALVELRSLNGLARIYYTGESAPRPAAHPAPHLTDQRPFTVPAPAARSVRPTNPAAQAAPGTPAPTRTISRPLPPEELVKAPARPRHHAAARILAARPQHPRPQTIVHLTPRRSYSVPHRPNRLITSTGTPLAASAPTAAAHSPARPPAPACAFAPLAPRVRLVSHTTHNQSVLPLTFSSPDPAWQTTYGRLAAISRTA